MFFFVFLFFFGASTSKADDCDGGGCGVSSRTWVLLLGMSGLIVLFWLLNGGEVLRYLVSVIYFP